MELICSRQDACAYRPFLGGAGSGMASRRALSVRGLFLVRCRAGLGQEIHGGVGAQPLSLPDASMPWSVIPAVPGEAAGDRAESFFRGHGTGESI